MSETQFIKGDKVRNFTVIDNTCLQDPTLSWAAKGFHSYLESLPGNWQIVKTDLIKRSRDKLYALNSIIEELKAAGYIVIEMQKREADGRFGQKSYTVYEKPIQITKESNRSWFPDTGNPITDNPITGNQQLLNTNKLNTEIIKTELTNSEIAVRESAFVNIIKSLFNNEYPFDMDFESEVMARLSSSEIEEINLESYLRYVFERTKLGNVQKSFEGLYRKLALANSIVRDFKNSSFLKNDEKTKKAEIKIRYVDCPICFTRFKEFDFTCPTCGVSMKEIKSQTQVNFIIKKKVYEMNESEKQRYENAYEERMNQIKQKTGRPFLTEEERVQFWKAYGLLD